MRTLSLVALFGLVFGAGVGAAPPDPRGDPQVNWRERAHALDALPVGIAEPAAHALAAWAAWAGERGYRLDLEDDSRVLLISPARSGGWKGQMRLVDRTLRRFEAELPAPPRAAPAAAPAAPVSTPRSSGPAPLPEDPDDGPLPEDPEDARPAGGAAPSAAATSADETVAPDTETIVFFVARTEDDFAEIVTRLAQDHAYLAEWKAAALRTTGFTLERPLAGAYVANASGQEEWNSDNELVHRLAELLLLRRFGPMPYWLAQGFAWHLEEELLRGLYCFPYRDEFVYATEHTAWPGELQRESADRRGPVTLEELDFPRGRFDGVRGRRAFGAVRFCIEHRPGKLSAALEALRLFRAEQNRSMNADGSWSRARFYDPPLADQARLMREQLGADVFDEMAKSFRLGDAYGK
jgi:hypothetical protein